MSEIDLHLHSAYSLDADLTVSALLERCIACGVSTLAITDHNAVHSVSEARVLAQEHDLTVLSGVEIDCAFEGNNYHVLGYGFTGDLTDFNALEGAYNQGQADAVPQKLEKLAALGIVLDEAHLYHRAKDRIPHEELMAELILEDERNTRHPLLVPYRAGGGRANMPYVNFFWDFFATGASCHTPVSYPALGQMVELIRANHGIPVIAHIGANLKNTHDRVLDGMRAVGLMGVEVFSNYHCADLANVLFDYAVAHDLHVTCGSDFHGKNKPGIKPGQCDPSEPAARAIEAFVAAAL